VFHKPEDFAAFARRVSEAGERLPMRLVGWCLMTNHFHLVLWPHNDGDLSRWMQWLLTAPVRRYHKQYQSSGHVWQGRFKAFPIEQDEHLAMVLRSVERNPVRAGLVARAEEWGWSSLSAVTAPDHPTVHPGPAPRRRDWRAWAHPIETEAALAALRQSIIRGAPFGSERWKTRTAKALGLESSLQPRGRPRKSKRTRRK
jgi:putative transposase